MTSIYDLNRKCNTDEKNCCPPLPHYTLPITDQDFINRNIELTNEGTGIDPMDTLYTERYVGDMDWVEAESKTMSKCDYQEWKRQEDIARRNIMPTKFWQDLNQGRRGYARGLSDDLDLTIEERNNFASGWYNAKTKDSYQVQPGGAPYRRPYMELKEPVNPMNYRRPITNNVSLGNRKYFWDIYSLNEYPDMYCKCWPSKDVLLQEHKMDWRRGQTCPTCNKKQMMSYPERYN